MYMHVINVKEFWYIRTLEMDLLTSVNKQKKAGG